MCESVCVCVLSALGVDMTSFCLAARPPVRPSVRLSPLSVSVWCVPACSLPPFPPRLVFAALLSPWRRALAHRPPPTTFPPLLSRANAQQHTPQRVRLPVSSLSLLAPLLVASSSLVWLCSLQCAITCSTILFFYFCFSSTRRTSALPRSLPFSGFPVFLSLHCKVLADSPRDYSGFGSTPAYGLFRLASSPQ